MLVIPYFTMPPIRPFGMVPIQPFGVLVCLAIVVGYFLGRRRAATTGLDRQLATDAMFWMLVGGFVMSHVVDLLFYYPEELVRNPFVLLTIWSDISSVGGFLGGALGAWLFFRRHGIPALPYTDAIMFGLVPAWIFGRMGCALAHDHPGQATSFLLGVRFPDGVVRHDLGLEEMLFTVLLTTVLYLSSRLRPFPGFHTALVLILYAPVRFLLDFLRIADKTYLGLTPAQYFCVAMLSFGVYLLVSGVRNKPGRPEQESPSVG